MISFHLRKTTISNIVVTKIFKNKKIKKLPKYADPHSLIYMKNR